MFEIFFNIPMTSMDRYSRQKINKDILSLNDTLDQMDLIDTAEYFTPKQQNDILFNAHGKFSSIDHMLGHKKNFNKFKKI